jgi:hypothetical protein
MLERVDALGVQFAEEVEQVDQRAAQAVDRPCCDHVDVAAGDGLQQAIEPGRLSRPLAPGDTGVFEKVDHAPVIALRAALLRTCGSPRRSGPRQMPSISHRSDVPQDPRRAE